MTRTDGRWAWAVLFAWAVAGCGDASDGNMDAGDGGDASNTDDTDLGSDTGTDGNGWESSSDLGIIPSILTPVEDCEIYAVEKVFPELTNDPSHWLLGSTASNLMLINSIGEEYRFAGEEVLRRRLAWTFISSAWSDHAGVSYIAGSDNRDSSDVFVARDDGGTWVDLGYPGESVDAMIGDDAGRLLLFDHNGSLWSYHSGVWTLLKDNTMGPSCGAMGGLCFDHRLFTRLGSDAFASLVGESTSVFAEYVAIVGHFDGGWIEVPIDTSSVQGIFGAASDDVYFLLTDRVVHFNGADVDTEQLLPAADFHGVVPMGDGRVILLSRTLGQQLWDDGTLQDLPLPAGADNTVWREGRALQDEAYAFFDYGHRFFLIEEGDVHSFNENASSVVQQLWQQDSQTWFFTGRDELTDALELRRNASGTVTTLCDFQAATTTSIWGRDDDLWIGALSEDDAALLVRRDGSACTTLNIESMLTAAGLSACGRIEQIVGRNDPVEITFQCRSGLIVQLVDGQITDSDTLDFQFERSLLVTADNRLIAWDADELFESVEGERVVLSTIGLNLSSHVAIRDLFEMPDGTWYLATHGYGHPRLFRLQDEVWLEVSIEGYVSVYDKAFALAPHLLAFLWDRDPITIFDGTDEVEYPVGIFYNWEEFYSKTACATADSFLIGRGFRFSDLFRACPNLVRRAMSM